MSTPNLDGISAVPNADTATDTEVVEFGEKFIRGYVAKLLMDYERTRLAIELQANNKGEPVSTLSKLKLALQERTIKTLHRFADIVKEQSNGDSYSPGETREAKD